MGADPDIYILNLLIIVKGFSDTEPPAIRALRPRYMNKKYGRVSQKGL